MISPQAYLKALSLQQDPKHPGGQELILGEIVGAFAHAGCERIYLPFPTVPLILAFIHAGLKSYAYQTGTDGLYLGTPTIVNDKPLFPQKDVWTKAYERQYVSSQCKDAIAEGMKMIVTGLGSGDISVEERIEDMGGGEVIAYKKFDTFCDWVIARKL